MSESHETRPDRVLIAIPTRCRNWWDDCKGCVFEGDPRKCANHAVALRKLRWVGCKPKQKWVEA